MKKYSDIFIGIFIIIISAGILVMSKDLPADSAIFPRLVVGIMIFLSVLMIISSIRVGKHEDTNTESTEKKIDYKDILKAILLILTYIILITKLGFFTSTTLFIASFMICFGERSVKKILSAVVILNFFIYLIFVTQLNVPLPQGLIF